MDLSLTWSEKKEIDINIRRDQEFHQKYANPYTLIDQLFNKTALTYRRNVGTPGETAYGKNCDLLKKQEQKQTSCNETAAKWCTPLLKKKEETRDRSANNFPKNLMMQMKDENSNKTKDTTEIRTTLKLHKRQWISKETLKALGMGTAELYMNCCWIC